MKIKRIISGIILLAVTAIILILGNNTIVNMSISIVALIAINEYFNAFKNKNNVDRWFGNILAILLAFIGKIPTEAIILIVPVLIALLFIKVIKKLGFDLIKTKLFVLLVIQIVFRRSLTNIPK